MNRKAERPGATGRGRRKGLCDSTANYSNTAVRTLSPERLIPRIIEPQHRDPGLHALELHIAGRDTATLLADLEAIGTAPACFDRLIRNRRLLTVAELRERGAA